MTALARLALLLGLHRGAPEPVRTWRDARPVLVGALVHPGRALSVGEAP